MFLFAICMYDLMHRYLIIMGLHISGLYALWDMNSTLEKNNISSKYSEYTPYNYYMYIHIHAPMN